MSDHVIFIRPFGDAFRVTVEPPVADRDYEAIKSDLRGARGYASGLKLSLAIPVVDLSGEVLS